MKRRRHCCEEDMETEEINHKCPMNQIQIPKHRNIENIDCKIYQSYNNTKNWLKITGGCESNKNCENDSDLTIHTNGLDKLE